MMRIGLISLGRRGSGGLISLELARGLEKVASVFTLLSENSEHNPAWRQSGIQQIVVPTYTSLFPALFSYLNPYLFKRLAAKVRAEGPDVLLYPMFFTWNPFLQHWLRDIPAVVAVHDPVPHPGIVDSLFHRLENIAIHQAARILIFSQTFIPDLEKRGVPRERIVVIPHGPLVVTDKKTERKPSFETGVTRLLFFGRITSYKGLGVLLQAYKQVYSQHALSLTVVGSGDLKPYAALLKGLPGVRLVNRWVSDLELGDYFSEADIVVLPYTSASQSGVIPLVSSYGLPVIVSQTGGIPEQVQDGATGILVTPGSVEELAAAILNLAGDPVLRRKLGEGLHYEHMENRNWDSISMKVYAACQQAARDREG